MSRRAIESGTPLRPMPQTPPTDPRRTSKRTASVVVLVLWLLVGTATGCRSVGDSAPGIDCLIITVLEEEYQAALGKLDRHDRVPAKPSPANPYRWVAGEIDGDADRPPFDVVVGVAGHTGQVAGALTVRDGLARWRPRNAFLVGIAGGIDGQAALGDVVVATGIWGYELGHLANDFRPRPVHLHPPDQVLESAAREATDAWRWTLASPIPSTAAPPAVIFGTVASGDKVIEHSASGYFADLIEANPQIVAVEMEGFGSAIAVREARFQGMATHFIMIRAISDLVSPVLPGVSEGDTVESIRNPQRDLWKARASEVAAAFAIETMKAAERARVASGSSP